MQTTSFVNPTDENYIETFSGQAFYFLKPDPGTIDIIDIAHALSQQCRYMGHTRKFYSVAEHLCHVSEYIGRKFAGYPDVKKRKRTGLLHDGSEAYIVDIARPIKACLPDYKGIEYPIEDVLASKYDLYYPFPDWLREADTRILINERDVLMDSRKLNKWSTEHLQPLEDVRIYSFIPERAKMLFLQLWNDVKPEGFPLVDPYA